MGTNYYWHEQQPCPTCGREFEGIHIGKSSVGWCFALCIYPDEGINGLDDWEQRLSSGYITDEYSKTITAAKMLEIITERSGGGLMHGDEDHVPMGYPSWWSFYDANRAEPGPNNLLRHRIDMTFCVGHGNGTYDLIVGEFS